MLPHPGAGQTTCTSFLIVCQPDTVHENGRSGLALVSGRGAQRQRWSWPPARGEGVLLCRPMSEQLLLLSLLLGLLAAWGCLLLRAAAAAEALAAAPAPLILPTPAAQGKRTSAGAEASDAAAKRLKQQAIAGGTSEQVSRVRHFLPAAYKMLVWNSDIEGS